MSLSDHYYRNVGPLAHSLAAIVAGTNHTKHYDRHRTSSTEIHLPSFGMGADPEHLSYNWLPRADSRTMFGRQFKPEGRAYYIQRALESLEQALDRLIQDGQSVEYGHYFKECVSTNDCSGFLKQVVGNEQGRSRLGYLLATSITYNGKGLIPLFQHQQKAWW